MTILEAALKSSVFEAAIAYHEAGVSILPLRGKQPALQYWAMLQQRRALLSSVLSWHRYGQLKGVGVICGRISGNLVVLDFDSSAAVDEFRVTFPTLLDTLIVLSGSRRGAHFYYFVDDLPQNTIAPNFELRANGCYVAAPPSPHASGHLYKVEKRAEPLRLPGMGAVAEWIRSKRNAPLVTKSPQTPLARPLAHTGGFMPRDEYFRRRYVRTALESQIARIRAAAIGQRNKQLYGGAVALGQIVGAGALARTTVETELLNAALHIGLSQAEALATIKSGLDAGEKQPRVIPSAPKLDD